MTAKESGTYNDFTNINLAGLKRDGSDGVNEVSYLLLEVLDEMQLLQPQANVQISHKTPERFLKAACHVIRKGSGYPSVFNADEVIMEQLRTGKTLEDAREGGTSGCIETGSFGKEAFILTGYLNVPKILEVTLNNGSDPLTGHTVGLQTGDPRNFTSFDALYGAFEKQLNYFVDLKIRMNNTSSSMYASYAPAPFLSVVIRDCISQGQGLLQRRATVQHQLYPVLRHRDHHGQPVRHQAACFRGENGPDGSSFERASKELRRRRIATADAV